MFHVGQLVVCVDADDFPIKTPGPVLVKGCVYTVDRINDLQFSELAITVAEMPFTYFENGSEYEGWYAARRFRPVDNNRISIFRQMLAPKPKERVEA